MIASDHFFFGLSDQIAYGAPFVGNSVLYMNGFMDAVGIVTADVVGLSLGA